jgi:hypothetical protein
VGVESALHRPLAVGDIAVAGQGHQPYVLAFVGGPNAPGDLETVEPGQADVDEHHFGPRGQGRVDRPGAVGSHVHAVAADFEQTAYGLTGIGVVFDNEDVTSHDAHGTRSRPSVATHEKIFYYLLLPVAFAYTIFS